MDFMTPFLIDTNMFMSLATKDTICQLLKRHSRFSWYISLVRISVDNLISLSQGFMNIDLDFALFAGDPLDVVDLLQSQKIVKKAGKYTVFMSCIRLCLTN